MKKIGHIIVIEEYFCLLKKNVTKNEFVSIPCLRIYLKKLLRNLKRKSDGNK